MYHQTAARSLPTKVAKPVRLCRGHDALAQAAIRRTMPALRSHDEEPCVGSVRQRRPREKIRATAFGPETPLLVAAAVERMAIFPGVAKVPDARMRGMALAGLDRDQPFAAAGKPLELDRRKRVLRQQAAEHQNKNDVSLFHMHTQSFSTPTRSKAQGRLSKRVAGCQFSPACGGRSAARPARELAEPAAEGLAKRFGS
jgi:hypothetical protein